MTNLSLSKNLIIIPCYNEEYRLDVVSFSQFAIDFPNIYFFFVDDGSTDNTAIVLQKLSAAFDNIDFLILKKNVGKGEAIRSGVLFHKANANEYNFIGYFDADLSAPLSEILNLITVCKKDPKIKFIMGIRLARLGANIQRNWHRHYLGRIFATFVSAILRMPVYDTQSGSKLIHSSIVFHLFKDPFISKWLFDVELLFRYKKATFQDKGLIVEIPLNEWVEKAGSKIKIINFFHAPFQLMRIWKHYKKIK